MSGDPSSNRRADASFGVSSCRAWCSSAADYAIICSITQMADRQRNTFSGATLKDTASGGGVVLMARTTLVFYHRDGAITAHLEKGRSLIVGRAAPSNVEIHDLNLSRQHARFSWDDHGLWVEDLGSTNGTKKNGEKLDGTGVRVRIAPGDEIAVGPVMVSIHVLSSIDEEL
ncbi:MAG: FHA domain-containing protein, partial [Kofleriaceae bacterium]